MRSKHDSQMTPSTCQSKVWLYVYGPKVKIEDTLYSGKWMIFPSIKSVDALWKQVKRYVEQGKLGFAAKVSTLTQYLTLSGYKNFLICIYTRDWRDKTDVGKALKTIREIGVKGTLYYKSDEQTRQGIYAGGPKKASLYSSKDFEI